MRNTMIKKLLLNQGKWETVEGVPPLTLEKSLGKDLRDYKLYGNSIQDGTPTPDTPVEVQNVGEYDETTGKYKITITTSNGIETKNTDIYLDEPLRKIDKFSDYIDFEYGIVVRNIASVNIKKVDGMSGVTTGTYCVFLSNISLKPYLVGTATKVIGYAISNKFKQSEVIYDKLYNYGGLIQTYITTSGSPRLAYTFNSTEIRSMAKAQTEIGEGFDVCFVLATPTETSIDLPKIPTLKGTTILDVDTAIKLSNISATYKRR